ncbi:hypothetical protein ACS0TY_022618 [Phlomoides rotata]
MKEDRCAGPPYAVIIIVIVAATLLLPTFFGFGNEDEDVSNSRGVSEVLSPVCLLFLPITLILTIHYLSSTAGKFSFTIDRNSIHRASATPVGVVMVLFLVLLLLYFKVSIFRGYEDFE